MCGRHQNTNFIRPMPVQFFYFMVIQFPCNVQELTETTQKVPKENEGLSILCKIKLSWRERSSQCRGNEGSWAALCRERSYYYFFLFRVAPAAYGSSQARGQVEATAIGLRHSHSGERPEPCL